MSIFLSQTPFPLSAASDETVSRVVHILIMGLTGAGKSTFISKATGDTTIEINGDLDAGTTEVAEYILYVDDYEVHPIDTPGFDAPMKMDAEVLNDMATMVNTIHQLQEPLARVLYLYDISRSKMGAGGERNIRLLEEFLGKLNFANCTLVTAKSGTLKDPKLELVHERQLESDQRYWKALRGESEDKSQARLARFTNDQASAIAIIKSLHEQSFTPAIIQQMVASDNSNLAVGGTNAGQLVGDSGERRLRAAGRVAEIDRLKAMLQRKFDQEKLELYLKELRILERQMGLKRGVRWTTRFIVIGCSLMGAVMTDNPLPASTAIGVVGALETSGVFSKEKDEEKIRALKLKYGILSYDTVNNNDI